MGEWRFKLLYDGECLFCRREVRWLQHRNHHGQLAFEDITSPGFEPARYGATREELRGVIHGVFPDGRIVRKLEVFRQAYRLIGLGWLVAPTDWPGLRWISDRLYVVFARNRVSLGRLFGRSCETGACNVPPQNHYGKIIVAILAAIILTGGIELWMGRSLFGPDGKFGLWESSIWSSENSQRVADPYSFSHITHGILFYAGLWLIARKNTHSPPIADRRAAGSRLGNSRKFSAHHQSLSRSHYLAGLRRR
ncbi:MAG: DUF2585 family protein [Limisphaerales bacterium]